MRKPAVLSLFLLVHEADPVMHAAVGPTLTQQTADESLLKPASMTKKERRSEDRGSNVPKNYKKSCLEVDKINHLLQ